MAKVGVVGGGPAGLSAALYTQKNGLDTLVFDTDKTWMHQAHLFNYPGIGSMDGSVWIQQARNQVEAFNAEFLADTEIQEIELDKDHFRLIAEEEQQTVSYLILATGTDRQLAEQLGCEFNGDLVEVDLNMKTSVENAYATGGMVRDQRWQAIISAGDGATAALDVLSKEKGTGFHDFDTPEEAALQLRGIE